MRPVGGDALDHPERVILSSGAAARPRNRAVHPRVGGWELLGRDYLPGRSGEHRESMSAGVGIHADDEWVRMRDDGPCG